MDRKQSLQTANEFLIYATILVSLAVFVLASFLQLGVDIGQWQIALLIVILVMLLFRHFSRIEIPGFLNLSKEVEEVKKETRELKTALQMWALSQSNASAVVNINNVMRALDESAAEAVEIDKEIPLNPRPTAADRDSLAEIANEVRDHVGEGHFVAAFAALRNKMETSLKELIVMRGGEVKPHASFYQLLRIASKQASLDSNVIEAIHVVHSAANTILHSAPYERNMPAAEAKQISELGIKVLYELESAKN